MATAHPASLGCAAAVSAGGNRGPDLARTGRAWWNELPDWYARHGRHDLAWRNTTDPWAILVSEVMLQQTAVSRVQAQWAAFMERWPTPSSCAAAPLDELMRAWQGLGYPRRARALHACAARVSAVGWPVDERGLRELPGIGPYTARALLAFAFGGEGPPPRDVNLTRVAARAAIGVEPAAAPTSAVERALLASQACGLGARHHAYALFDLGATVCSSRRPHCEKCPLHACRSRQRLLLGPPQRAPRRQHPYPGSMRQLRGVVLRALIDADGRPTSLGALRARIAPVGSTHSEAALADAVSSLARDGLIATDCAHALLETEGGGGSDQVGTARIRP